MNSRSPHKLPKSKQEKQALLNDEAFVNGWAQIASSEIFASAMELCIDKVVESHPPHEISHIHTYNVITINAVNNLKRMFIEGALDAKYKEEATDDEIPTLM